MWEAVQESREEGREEGRKEGSQMKCLEVARRALKMNMKLEKICILTDLEVSEILNLQNSTTV